MKKFIHIIFSGIILCLFSCTTSTANESFALGAQGKFERLLAYNASKDEIKIATMNSLSTLGYHFTKEGDSIRSEMNAGGISSVMLLSFEDNLLKINCKGSQAKNKPLVPLRRIDQLNKRIQKNLALNRK